eukprot:9110227-Alexandrium_andersonii.AAC.1
MLLRGVPRQADDERSASVPLERDEQGQGRPVRLLCLRRPRDEDRGVASLQQLLLALRRAPP